MYLFCVWIASVEGVSICNMLAWVHGCMVAVDLVNDLCKAFWAKLFGKAPYINSHHYYSSENTVLQTREGFECNCHVRQENAFYFFTVALHNAIFSTLKLICFFTWYLLLGTKSRVWFYRTEYYSTLKLTICLRRIGSSGKVWTFVTAEFFPMHSSRACNELSLHLRFSDSIFSMEFVSRDPSPDMLTRSWQ